VERCTCIIRFWVVICDCPLYMVLSSRGRRTGRYDEWSKNKSILNAIKSNIFLTSQELPRNPFGGVRFLVACSNTPQCYPEQRRSRRTVNSVLVLGKRLFFADILSASAQNIVDVARPVYPIYCSMKSMTLCCIDYCKTVTIHSSIKEPLCVYVKFPYPY